MKLSECKLGLKVENIMTILWHRGIIVGYDYFYGNICPIVKTDDIFVSVLMVPYGLMLVSNEINDIGKDYDKNLKAIEMLLDKDPEEKTQDYIMLEHLANAVSDYEDVFFRIKTT